MNSDPLVDVYTDGACSGNPGPGGWAAVIVFGQIEKEISGGEALTTNNRMELMAAIEALKQLNKPCRVRLHSDSAYLINAFTQGWIDSWKRNGWKNSTRQTVSNIDLWQQLDALSAKHKIEWIKVKGHSGHEYNERCDVLAVRETNLRKS
ncbi:MAG: ribonuclease HI [Clostridiaceae bacterium]|nr:ribonuclease HI [Clostridiaceae bacterium]